MRSKCFIYHRYCLTDNIDSFYAYIEEHGGLKKYLDSAEVTKRLLSLNSHGVFDDIEYKIAKKSLIRNGITIECYGVVRGHCPSDSRGSRGWPRKDLRERDKDFRERYSGIVEFLSEKELYQQ